jgi:hypothetical protein
VKRSNHRLDRLRRSLAQFKTFAVRKSPRPDGTLRCLKEHRAKPIAFVQRRQYPTVLVSAVLPALLPCDESNCNAITMPTKATPKLATKLTSVRMPTATAKTIDSRTPAGTADCGLNTSRIPNPL